AKARDSKLSETNTCVITRGIEEERMEPEVNSENIAEPNLLADAARDAAARAAAAAPPEPTAEQAAVARENERVRGIIAGCRAVRVSQAFPDSLINDPKVTLEQAQTGILAELSRRGGDDRAGAQGPSGHVEVGADPLVH